MTAPRPDDLPLDLDELLQSGSWIRRLARGLVRGEARADELAQEVLTRAWAQRPALGGVQLRAWLGTVARRLARRERERDHARLRAETQAARPEATEDAAQGRLALHRRLVQAIDGLPPIYRTALVLRYLDELPPRVIATQLGLTVSAARKRVSRGLALLREALDEEFEGGREEWTLALAPLLAPPAPPSSAPAPALPVTLWTIMTTKQWLGLAAVVLGVGLLVLDPFGIGPGSRGEATAELNDASLAPRPERDEVTQTALASAAAEPDRQAVPSDTTAPVTASPRVRVVGPDGRPRPRARLAWVDAHGQMHVLELDAAGSAARPDDSAEQRFFACTPALEEGGTQGGPDHQDVLVELEAPRTLEGRLLVDGGPPIEALQLTTSPGRPLGVASGEGELWMMLRESGAVRPHIKAHTRSDGSFVLEGLMPDRPGWIYLPSTHRTLLVNGATPGGERTIARFTEETRHLEVSCTRLPTVSGRVLWKDDDTPLEGTISVALMERTSVVTMNASATPDLDGRFVIGLPIPERELLLAPDERDGSLLHTQLYITVVATNGTPGVFVHEVDLYATPPPLDLGDLRVPRARELALRLLGPEGEPVRGATVATRSGSTTSDETGLAQIAIRSRDHVHVLAPGYSLGDLAVQDEDANRAEPLELGLGLGTTLLVRLPAGFRPSIRLRWAQSPFELGSSEAGLIRGQFPYAVHQAFHGDTTIVPRWNGPPDNAMGNLTLPAPATGPLVIPGLRPGSELELSMRNAAWQFPDWTRIVLPTAPGRHEIDLIPAETSASTLRIRLTDASGLAIEGSSVLVKGKDETSNALYLAGDLIELEPVARGVYVIWGQAPGYITSEHIEVELRADSEPFEIRLEPARALTVHYLDESRRPLPARAISLRDSSGWTLDIDDPTLGETWFERVPRKPLELELRIGTQVHTATVDATQDEVELALPAHGLVSIRMPAPPVLDQRNGRLRARITALDGGAALELRQWFTEQSNGPLLLESELLPGEYTLELDLLQHEPGAMEGDPHHVRELARREFAIAADQDTVITVP